MGLYTLSVVDVGVAVGGVHTSVADLAVGAGVYTVSVVDLGVGDGGVHPITGRSSSGCWGVHRIIGLYRR